MVRIRSCELRIRAASYCRGGVSILPFDTSGDGKLAGNKGSIGGDRFAICSYFFAGCLLLAVFAMIGIFPFGTYSILKLDLLHAYAPDYLEFSRILKNGDDLLYSWHSLLGANILGSAITIASNPINLLTLVVPEQYQAEFLSVLVLIKLPFAAVTFNIWIKNRLNMSGIISVLFSGAYALCAYVTAYHFNIMWIDSVILLPLVFLGIDLILDRDDATVYCASLILVILTSYGTAIQICAFAVIHFILGMVLRSKYSAKKCKSFITYSILAGGVCSIYLVALMDSLHHSQYFREALPASALQISPLRLLAAHFWGTTAAVKFYSDSAPNIYCGVFPVLLLTSFLSSKEISRREKTVFGTYILILLISFSWNVATFLLHGLHFPTMFPHRYSYIYSFALLTAAARAYKSRPQLSRRTAWLTALAFFAVLAAAFLIYPQYDAQSAKLLERLLGSANTEVRPPVPGRLSALSFALNILLVCIYIGLSRGLFCENTRACRASEAVLVVVFSAELLFGAFLNIRDNNTVETSWYNRDLSGDMRAVTAILNKEDAFYRAESARYRAQSGGRVYGYNGISGFSVSSGEYPTGLQNLLYHMGMSSSFNNLMWNTPSPVVSSLFAQKYLIVDYEGAGRAVQMFDYSGDYGDLHLYENPYVLPVGFMTSEKAINWMPTNGNDPFVEQSSLFTALTGQEKVWTEIRPSSFAVENMVISEEESGFSFEIPSYISSGDVLDDSVLPRAGIRYQPTRDGYMMMSVRCKGASWATVSVNGETVSSQPIPWGYSSIDAGYVNAGDLVELYLDFNVFREGGERELIRQDKALLHAAQLNIEPFKAGISILKQTGLAVDSYDNTHLFGTVSSAEGGMLWTSIPWDHNWHIFVDGTETKAVQSHGALTAVPLEAGTHKIEFLYRMDVLPVGATASVVFLIITVLSLSANAKKRRRQAKL